MKSRKTFNRNISAVLAVMLVIAVAVTSGLNNPAYAFSTFTGSSPYSGVAYGTYYHNADKFKGDLILNGVDVSEYQSSNKSNWSTAWNNGVDYAILRVTWTGYGSSGSKNNDVNFSQHYSKAKKAGVLVGAYVFSQACSNSEAEAEAKYAIKRLQALGIGPEDMDLPVYMDYEFAGPSSSGRMYLAKRRGALTKAKATEYARTFCKTIKAAGYTPGIYASTSFLWNTIDGASLGKSYDIWAAQYWKKCEFDEGPYTKWQYSSAAKIKGIYNSYGNTMNTDVNFWYLEKNRKAASSSSRDVANCTFSVASNVKYTGSQVKPAVTVKYKGTKLTKGKDYSVGYIRNKKLGTAYAYIKGQGSYWNYKLVPFKIVKELPSSEPESGEDLNSITKYVTLASKASKAGYSLSSSQLSGVISGSTAAGALKSVTLKDSYSKYKVKVVKASTGAALSGSTKVATGHMLIVENTSGKKVAEAKLKVNGTATILFNHSEWVYNGKERRPSVTLKFGSYTAASSLYEGNSNCSISYESGRKLPGKYTVTVKGKGVFQGTYTRDYEIQVKKTSLVSVKPTSKAGFTATWDEKSAERISGYQLQYSRYTDMSNDLVDTIKSTTTTSKKVTGRYSGNKYYVRVRCYRTIDGKKYYSPWSSKMSVYVK